MLKRLIEKEKYDKIKPIMNKNNFTKIKYILVVTGIMLLALLSLGGCDRTGAFEANQNELAKLSPADLSGYSSMAGYEGEIMLRDVDVRQVADFMSRRESFILFTGFPDCPWCNALMPTLNTMASERHVLIAYINTRKNPEWQSNMDIDDYDDFVDLFGDWISEDGEGLKHLYVPTTFFVENGECVMVHSGVTPSLENPDDEMTEEIVAELEEALKEKFERVTLNK